MKTKMRMIIRHAHQHTMVHTGNFLSSREVSPHGALLSIDCFIGNLSMLRRPIEMWMSYKTLELSRMVPTGFEKMTEHEKKEFIEKKLPGKKLTTYCTPHVEKRVKPKKVENKEPTKEKRRWFGKPKPQVPKLA